MADEKKEQDQSGLDEVKNAVPEGSNSGETGNKEDAEAHSKLPEGLEGKSAEDIANMYVNLQKKLGEQSNEISKAREIENQVNVLMKAIYSDVDLYNKVEAAVQEIQGGKIPTKDSKGKSDSDEGADGSDKDLEDVRDIRTAEENRVLSEFYNKFGYSNLEQEDRKKKLAQLVSSLGEIVDPGGKKPIKQVLRGIPLAKLPKYLEHAHFIANKDMVIDQAKKSALLESRENESASIGSFAASSDKGENDVSLSKREREVAQRMGLSEKDYASMKKEIAEKDARFE